MENEKDFKIKYLRFDNGEKYYSKKFEEFYSKYGIRRQLTVSRTPQQNSMAERFNRTLMDRIRSMLSTTKFDKRF